jgi:zinc/manganese transport system substrate-binding protein
VTVPSVQTISARAPRVLATAAAVLLAALCLLASGCGDAGPDSAAGSGKLRVVAAESTWGSIAAQIGGDHVEVTDIISSPAADPHDYEPTSEDARTIAGAQLMIVNGIGYDFWASDLLEANPSSPKVVEVGRVGSLEGDNNPHQWYSPAAVRRVAARINLVYRIAEPQYAAYFRQQRRHFERVGLHEYDDLIARIRSRFGGTPVGASESIFAPLARALGLRLVTPHGFLNAVSEGTEPTPAEKIEADRQIADHEIAVWVYNSQNATPDVQRLNDAAGAAGIPVTSVTEMPTPEGVSFQAWQVRQLRSLEAALEKARGGR